MSYTIRPAQMADFSRILDIYRRARQFMRDAGNPNQWGDSHPAESILREDISKGQLFLCVDADDILCVFAYIRGIDPTYLVIEGGNWLNDEPYGVIHRMAVSRPGQGIAAHCFDWALEQCRNLRIDTHEQNLPMQAALKKSGFTRCGIIYLLSGDARIAFHKHR